MDQLIAPYGGILVNLIDPAKSESLKQEALSLLRSTSTGGSNASWKC